MLLYMDNYFALRSGKKNVLHIGVRMCNVQIICYNNAWLVFLTLCLVLGLLHSKILRPGFFFPPSGFGGRGILIWWVH
jgi:hypothetical protein